jgi:putative DNA primase/helicase
LAMYREFFSFVPVFKLLLVTNHRPRIAETTNAIWRRVVLVPFNVIIPVAERDRQLRSKLRAEAPGILTWAVRGCLEWQRDGLKVPLEILAATEEYRAEEDELAPFFSECCEFEAGARTSSKDLARAYGDWCRKNGADARRMNDVAAGLRARQCERDKKLGKRTWVGVRLRPEDTLDTSDTGFPEPPFVGVTEGSSPKQASTGVPGVQPLAREPGQEG